MIGLILHWVSGLFLSRKKDFALKEEIKSTWRELSRSLKAWNMQSIIKNNFDLKSSILRLFFASYVINYILLIFIIFATFIYTEAFFYVFLGSPIKGRDDPGWPWIGILVLNILFITCLIRLTRDYYKLSLRGIYRNNYSKLLWLDIFTLNILNVMASLIFATNKWQIPNLNFGDSEIKQLNLNSKSIQNYSKLIFKIDIFMLLLNLMIFALALVIGYFIKNNGIKLICLVFIAFTMILFYDWWILRIVALIITQRLLKNLLNYNSSYYFLMTLRFILFAFGPYYIAVLINVFKLNELDKKFILDNC